MLNSTRLQPGMSVQAQRKAIFEPFELDLDTGELRKHGIRIKLQQKPFLILRTLMQRPGELVTKDELHELLWAKDVFVDFDHGLNSALTRLRVALGDAAEQPRYIETIGRRGYRFIGKLHGADRPRKVMLAVLPFENLGADPEQDYFCDGLTEEMIAQLGRLDPARLGVIARTSSMQYKRTSKTAQQIGAELAVEYILEGSIRRSKDKVRVTAQLIQTSDQTHLWSQKYDHTFEDVLQVQSEAAAQISHSLADELLPNVHSTLHRGYSTDSETFELYLRARYYWNLRIEDGFAQALEYFHKVVERDPKYAPAYAGIADTYNILALYGAVPSQEAYRRAKAAAIKALQLDETLAEAHTSLGWTKIQHDWDAVGAETEHLRALELNPNYATGHHWYALYLGEVSRFDEAIVEIDRALELDPLSRVIGTHKGWILYFAHRFEEAVKQLQPLCDPAPPFPLANYFLGLSLLQLGRHDEAIAELRRAVVLSENHPGGLSGLCFALAKAGHGTEALSVLKQLKELAARRHVSPYFFAVASLGLGDKDAAVAYLNQCVEERSGWMAHLDVEAQLDDLRGDPRFAALRSLVGLNDKVAPLPAPADGSVQLIAESLPDIAAPVVQRARWQAHFYVALAAVFLLATATYVIRQQQSHEKSSRIRLLVLPMENLGGKPTEIPFADGMTEELTTELDRLNPKRLGVLARTTAGRYAGHSILQLRKELNVDYVIEGAVLKDGTRIRITVKLIQAKDETQAWASSYEEDARDAMDLQRRVATDIARHIAVELVGATTPRVLPVDPAAHEAFLRGRYFWNRRHLSSMKQSIAYFEQAIAKDPNYAAPYAGLADAYALLGSSQSGVLPPDVAFPKAKELALKSIQLDPNLAEPHASLGLIKLVYDHDEEGARQELERALQLDQNYATAHQWMGQYFIAKGEPKRAVESVRKALQLDPASLASNVALAEALYFDRDFDGAIEQAKKAVELDADSAISHFNLGRAYLMKNELPQALDEFSAARRATASPATLVPLGFTYGRMGRTVEANAALAQLKDESKHVYVPAIYFAMLYEGLNDNASALRELQRAKAEHSDYLVLLPLDPMADSLRKEPGFIGLLQ